MSNEISPTRVVHSLKHAGAEWGQWSCSCGANFWDDCPELAEQVLKHVEAGSTVYIVAPSGEEAPGLQRLVELLVAHAIIARSGGSAPMVADVDETFRRIVDPGDSGES